MQHWLLLVIVSAVPTVDPGWWSIGPAGKVGVARVAGIELSVKPKLPIRRLFFLLGYAADDRGWLDELVEVDDASDLLVALAYTFVRQADRALRQGLLQGYRQVDEALPVVRGRIRESEQMRRRYGLRPAGRGALRRLFRRHRGESTGPLSGRSPAAPSRHPSAHAAGIITRAAADCRRIGHSARCSNCRAGSHQG